MQIVRDDAKVARKAKIGRIASLVGLAVLIGGMAFSWFAPNWDIPAGMMLYVPFVALLIGFILSSLGTYYMNHWGRSPRPDEVIDASLKGLNRDYKLYHFGLPTPHLLLTPNGPVVLVVKAEGGKYELEGEKWRQRLTLGRVLSFMGREGLGNPTREAAYQVEQMRRFLAKEAPELAETAFQAIIVFTAEGVELDIKDESLPVLRAAKLKGFLRSDTTKLLPKETYRQLEAVFDQQAA